MTQILLFMEKFALHTLKKMKSVQFMKATENEFFKRVMKNLTVFKKFIQNNTDCKKQSFSFLFRKKDSEMKNISYFFSFRRSSQIILNLILFKIIITSEILKNN